MKKWMIIFLAELVLLLAGMIGLFRDGGVVYEADAEALTVDVQDEESVFLTDALALPAGVYEAVLTYETLEDGVHDFGVVAEEDLTFRGLRSNEVTLFSDKKEVTCQFYLTSSCEQLQAFVCEEEDGTVAVEKIRILGSNAGSRILIFWTILLSVLLNGAMWIYDKNAKEHFTKEKQITLTGCVIIVLLSSLPLFVDYVISADAVIGNLASVERISNDFSCVGDEGNFILAVPALLRKIGISMNMSYRLCLWMINAATVGVAFVSLYKCGRKEWGILAGVALWTLNPYRIWVVYENADLVTAAWLMIIPAGVALLWKLLRKLFRKEHAVSGKVWKRCAILLIVIMMFSATYQTNQILINGHPLWVYSMEDMMRADETGLTYLCEDTYGMK